MYSAEQRFGQVASLGDVKKAYAYSGPDGSTIEDLWLRSPRHSPTSEVDIGINPVRLDEVLAAVRPS